jgi:hypothetical protein
MTSKILFVDVIKVIKKYAFASSPYPVILSFENHCSADQQLRMAHIMKEIFGDMLALDPEKMGDTLPSPEALKFKILVKGKALAHTSEDEESSDEEAVPETPIDATTPLVSSDTASIAPSVSTLTTITTTDSSEGLTLPRSKVKVKIDPEFSKTIYLRGNHFKSFEASKRKKTKIL